MDCTFCAAKTKALISFTVTAKLICVFVFAYKKIWFSHNEAHIIVAILTLMSRIKNKALKIELISNYFNIFEQMI